MKKEVTSSKENHIWMLVLISLIGVSFLGNNLTGEGIFDFLKFNLGFDITNVKQGPTPNSLTITVKSNGDAYPGFKLIANSGSFTEEVIIPHSVLAFEIEKINVNFQSDPRSFNKITLVSCKDFDCNKLTRIKDDYSLDSQTVTTGENLAECNDDIDNDGDGLTDFPGDPECSNPLVNDECFAAHTIFKISSESNAHVAIPSIDYDYRICSDVPFPALVSSSRTCKCSNPDETYPNCVTSSSNLVAKLSSTDNAHLEKHTENLYPEEICFGELTCTYQSSCSEPFKCIASIAPSNPSEPDTNMHVGRCSAYETKICCKDATMFRLLSHPEEDDPTTPNIEILEYNQLTFSVIPENIPNGVSNWAWYYKIDESEIWHSSGTGSVIPEAQFIFNGEAGTQYDWFLEIAGHNSLGVPFHKLSEIDTIEIIEAPAEPCTLSAHWGTFSETIETAVVDQIVPLHISGTNCFNPTNPIAINLEVWERDHITSNDPADLGPSPNPVFMSSDGFTLSSWTAEKPLDEDLTNPEFFFNASLANDPSTSTSSGDLEVSEPLECTTNNDCNDNLYCNGIETCISNECQFGTPIVCSDSIGCTIDSCDESTNSCNFIPNNNLCSGSAICNPSQGCITEPTCGDNVVTNPPEDCEPIFGPQPCENQLGYSGTHSCRNDCTWGGCISTKFCGDEIRNGPESCDDGMHCKDGTPCQLGSECNDLLCIPRSGDGCSSSCVSESGGVICDLLKDPFCDQPPRKLHQR